MVSRDLKDQTGRLHVHGAGPDAEASGWSLVTGEIETVVDAMRWLPPHADVVPPLTRLRDAGIALTALTNSVLDVAEAQLVNAGIADVFEAILSADERILAAP